MPALSNPSEIAREALRLLAVRRSQPTPDNYRSLYHEIAGTKDTSADIFPERHLKALNAALSRQTPEQIRLTRRLDQALKNGSWDEFRDALSAFINEHSEVPELPWGELITDLLRQWESKQVGLTSAKKRDSLEHVLSSAASNNQTLFSRLQGLTKSWSQNASAADDLALVEGEIPAATGNVAPITPTGTPPSKAAELLPELRELFAYTLDTAVGAQLIDAPEHAAEARALATAVRGAYSLKALESMLGDLKRFAFRMELLAEDRTELRAGLLHLLQLLIENVSELVIDDSWLHGQIEVVREIVSQPLSLRGIDDAEYRLKEIIFKQSQLKLSLNEAREALKSMLAGFVDHLAEFADTTSDYHDKIEACASKISAAQDITQLEAVLAEVMSETRVIQLNAQRSRDELRAARVRVSEADKRINELQQELEQASTLVRNDQLTGTLNRRGLEEAFEKESARAQRRQSPFCVALLDIDNFKKLNDSLGHDAGDAALIHLSTVIRETMRPQDTIARFGGEEFVILLPDTEIEAATKALIRLQRELTKRFFLHGNDKLLITFSAGVTEMVASDNQATVIKRADEAMYRAKQTGKNKVLVSPPPALDQAHEQRR